MNSAQIAKSILDIGAVTLNTVTPYKYASGIYSPIYVDCRIISSFPKERRVIIESFMDYIDSFIGRDNIDVVVGSGHSGISLASYICQKLRLRMAYIRSAAKGHGKTNVVEGIVKDSDRVLLISDIFGTEGHIEHSLEVLKGFNANIMSVLTILDLNLNIVEDYLKKNGIKYYSLTDLRTLLETAAAEKKISVLERDEVLRWLSNPGNWQKNLKNSYKEDIQKIQIEIAKVLLRMKAVTLNSKQPYTYASGIRSPIYCDNRLLISYPEEWKKVIDSMLSIIIYQIGVSNIDIIAGTSTAGISHAAYVAEKLNLPMIYLKSKPEEHGKYNSIEGVLKPGQKVLIIEDLVSTGGSSIACVDITREAGGIVEYCLAIFTYGFEKAKKSFDDAKCTLINLSDFNTIVKVANEEGYLKPDELKMVQEWNKSPSEWGPKHGFPNAEPK